MPPDYRGFREYFERTTAELVHTQSADRVLSSISQAAPPPLPLPLPDRLWRMARVPAARMMWLGGLGPMSPALRSRLGVHWQRSDELAFRGLGRLTRGLDPVMPQRLRLMGPEQLRWRARAIARGPLGADAISGAA